MTTTLPRILGLLNEQPDKRLIACTWYRCIIPLKAMETAGFINHALMTIEKFNQLRGDKQLLPQLVQFDAALFQRVVESRQADRMDWRAGALTLRALGIAAIVDYDDDFTGEYRDLGADLPDLSQFNLVTVSTPYVRDQFLKAQPNLNIAVLPNMVVPSMFEGMARNVSPLVIGLTGSASHRQDWDAVVPALLRVKRQVPSVKILAAGYVPESLRSIPGLLTMRDLLPGDQEADPATLDHSFVSFHQYGGIVMRNIDILLCPVDPADRFSWGRSGIKALEGMAAGAVPVVTGDVPCYKDVIKDGVNGFAVNHNDTEAWYQRIMDLVMNPLLRMQMKRAGRNTASLASASKLTASTYYEAYRKAIAEASEPANVEQAQQRLLQLKQEKEREQSTERLSETSPQP